MRAVRGNADRELVALVRDPSGADRADAGSAWAAAQLTPTRVDLLAALPTTIDIEIAGLGVTTFCHATPRSDDEVLVVASPREA